LASKAASEGRIEGMNLYPLQMPRYKPANIAIYFSEVGDLGFGVAGLTHSMAEREGFSMLVGGSSVADRYPASMPGVREIYGRLIFCRQSLQLLGGQVVGGHTTGKLVNAIGIAIQTRAIAQESISFQFGPYPRVTGAEPPLIAVTEDALQEPP